MWLDGMETPPLIVILGPTAVGKTDVAIQLAQRLDCEIVSADSRLFYRGMDIGTAKPTPEQRAILPHHLIDVAEPDETWSLGVFHREAGKAIAGIHARGHLPLLVGGTGQYVRAVTGGWLPPAVQPDEGLRSALETLARERGPGWLHDRLRRMDPLAAERIDPRNLRRTVRALEVILLSGRKFSDQVARFPSPYRLCQLGLQRPRTELYARADARIETMFAAGLIDEVHALLERGYDPSLPSMSGIGYRECVEVLQGKMSVDSAKAAMKRRTRVLIRRQSNWFNEADSGVHWYNAGDLPTEQMELFVRHWLHHEPACA
jgi:tRNA dimethylallyltransferase